MAAFHERARRGAIPRRDASIRNILGAEAFRDISNLGGTIRKWRKRGTIPIALSEWNERGGFAHGDRIVLSAFGAGSPPAASFCAGRPSSTFNVRPGGPSLTTAGRID